MERIFTKKYSHIYLVIAVKKKRINAASVLHIDCRTKENREHKESSDMLHFSVKCCLYGLLKIIKLMIFKVSLVLLQVGIASQG